MAARKARKTTAKQRGLANWERFMPQTLEHPSTTYAPARGIQPSPPQDEKVSVSPDAQSGRGTSWPGIVLAAGGSGAGTALVVGSLLGPIGAIGGGVVGIVLGVLIQKSHRAN